jgi:hypothetical protein
MDVYFSTVARTAPVERGGEVVLLDWKTKEVRRRVPLVPSKPELGDLNPRGGRRGGMGIEFVGNEVLVATYDTLRVFDRDLQPRRSLSHPLMVGIHEVHPGGNGSLWVAATAIDAALELDLSTGDLRRHFWPREMPVFQERLGLLPSEVDKAADNRFQWMSGQHLRHPSHLHLNTVTTWKDEVYALFSKFGVITNLDRGEVVVEHPGLKGAHNLVIREDGMAFANLTAKHGIGIYDLQGRRVRGLIDVMRFDWVRELVRKGVLARVRRRVARKLGIRRVDGRVARPLFMRGMALADGSLFVGTSPASILHIDWERGELIDAFNYSPDVRVAVHGLKVLPG